MTTRTWAEDKVAKAVTGYQWNARIRKSTVRLPAIAAKLLLAEHKRAVRIVKKQFPDNWLHPFLTGPNAILPKSGQPITPKHVEQLIQAIKVDILAALERGRVKGGKR